MKNIQLSKMILQEAETKNIIVVFPKKDVTIHPVITLSSDKEFQEYTDAIMNIHKEYLEKFLKQIDQADGDLKLIKKATDSYQRLITDLEKVQSSIKLGKESGSDK